MMLLRWRAPRLLLLLLRLLVQVIVSTHPTRAHIHRRRHKQMRRRRRRGRSGARTICVFGQGAYPLFFFFLILRSATDAPPSTERSSSATCSPSSCPQRLQRPLRASPSRRSWRTPVRPQPHRPRLRARGHRRPAGRPRARRCRRLGLADGSTSRKRSLNLQLRPNLNLYLKRSTNSACPAQTALRRSCSMQALSREKTRARGGMICLKACCLRGLQGLLKSGGCSRRKRRRLKRSSSAAGEDG